MELGVLKHMAKNKNKKKILKDLKELDREILNLLSKRCKILHNHVKQKKEQKDSIIDSVLEKELWRQWEKNSHGKHLDGRLLRKIFNYINWLGYETKETEELTAWNFILNPPKLPTDIYIHGPRDRFCSRFWIVFCAGSHCNFDLDHVVLNDPTHQLLKGINQADGDFSWSGHRIVCNSQRDLNFEQRSIFIGDDELNLYLIIFLSLSKGGKFKFTGGNRLKTINLKHLFKILPDLGARAVSLIPEGEGLPIKIEASAIFNSKVVVPQASSAEMVASLILCSPFYDTPSGYINVYLPQNFKDEKLIPRVLEIFKKCNVEFEVKKKEIIIYKSKYEFPHNPEIYLDPLLSSFLLAFPQAYGGKTTLKGKYPLWLEEAKDLLDILLATDLKVDVFEDRIESKKEAKKASYFIDPHSPELFPISLGIGCLCEPESIIKLTGSGISSIELLDELELKYEIREDLLYLYPNFNSSFPKVNINTTDPIWNMVLGLISFKRPYINLNNPGSITAIWPQFWNIFKSFSMCRNWEIEEGRKKNETPRRRILVK